MAPLAALLLVRLFMIRHDCGHGSFLPSKAANEWEPWPAVQSNSIERRSQEEHEKSPTEPSNHHENYSGLHERNLARLDFRRLAVPSRKTGEMASHQAQSHQAQEEIKWLNLEPAGSTRREFLHRLPPGLYKLEFRLVAYPMFGRGKSILSLILLLLTIAAYPFFSLAKSGQWVATSVIETRSSQESAIGIMAYGSLIEEPGKEILAATEKILVADVKTPFPVEFARTSSKRAGAPTLIPYKGGERVPARIFMLRPQLSQQEAKNMLWRRETHTEDATKTYKAPETPGADDVVVETLHCLYGVHTVLFTRIGANIEPLTPSRLAELAWASACSKAIPAGSDGISYLIEAKRNRIKTKLSKDYETAIMSRAGAESLELAREKAWRTPP